jgi:hypothetical protein
MIQRPYPVAPARRAAEEQHSRKDQKPEQGERQQENRNEAEAHQPFPERATARVCGY